MISTLLSCMTEDVAEVLQNPYVVSASLFVVGLVTYWHKVVVGPVELHVKKLSKLDIFLRRSMTILMEDYKPTIWCFESRFQTIFASMVRGLLPDITYRREVMKFSDGGEAGLDWLDNPPSHSYYGEGADYRGPIILFLPGLTGHSQSEYMKSFINVAQREIGARCVVFNFRGRGGHTLTTPKTYSACNADDLSEVLDHIKSTYPKAPIMALGVSLGGILLGNYLSQQGERAREKLLAGMVVSVCYDTFRGTESLEQAGLNWLLNRHLANCLVASIKEVRHHFDRTGLWDLDNVFSSRTIREFDSRFTSPLFGYNDWKEYYANARLRGKLDRIKVPLLGLNALDDAFQPADSLPVDEASATDHVAIVTTRYGGHIGFMEGLLPTRYHFSDRVFAQYIKGVFHNQDELAKINSLTAT